MTRPTDDGVVLANGETGSAFFHRILSLGISQYPELASAKLPTSPGAFKKSYGDDLARYEVARLASPRRIDIATTLHDATLSSLSFQRGAEVSPLLESLKATRATAPKTSTTGAGTKGAYVPELPLDGVTHRGPTEVKNAVDRLHHDHHLSDAAADGLRWLMRFIDERGGTLDLSNERFVLLGASAELSPLSILLAAGAQVRWVDVKPPYRDGGAGTLVASDGGDDLLKDPHAAMAAIREFAAEGPVHLGCFAYAPGASRELRLAGVMDAMVHTLGAGLVKSVSLYISPTSPAELQPEDRAVCDHRAKSPHVWQRGFELVRSLQKRGYEVSGDAAVSRAVISLQGAAYQAAQYLMKIVSSEVLANRGLGGQHVTLSANVAGITNTRSLSHPLFQVGFVGAPLFGVRIFEPSTTRAVSGLLMLHDLLNPAAPGSSTRAFSNATERVKAVRSEQIHGGAYDLPWQFESAVRTAAVLGIGKRPGLLFKKATPAT